MDRSTSIEAAQAAIDAWVVEYNTRRPHQSLDMAYPADRFHTAGAEARTAAGGRAAAVEAAGGLGPGRWPSPAQRAAVEQEPPRQDTVMPGQRWVG